MYTYKRQIYLNINVKLDSVHIELTLRIFRATVFWGFFYAVSFHLWNSFRLARDVLRVLSVNLPVTFLEGHGARSSYMKAGVGTLALACTMSDC